MKVEIVHASRHEQRIETIEVAPGTTVGAALEQARSKGLFPGQQYNFVGLARFGRPATAEDVLWDGDRIELLRPLVADPKESRRRRAEIQAKRKRGK